MSGTTGSRDFGAEVRWAAGSHLTGQARHASLAANGLAIYGDSVHFKTGSGKLKGAILPAWPDPDRRVFHVEHFDQLASEFRIDLNGRPTGHVSPSPRTSRTGNRHYSTEIGDTA
jgi:hypothetical protein